MLGFRYLPYVLAKTTRLHGKAALGLVQLGVDYYQTLLAFRFYISEVVKEVEQGQHPLPWDSFLWHKVWLLQLRAAPAEGGS